MNKLVYFEDVIKLFDVFLVSESKLAQKFPNIQFRIIGYKIFRCDNNRCESGSVLYITGNIPCKSLQQDHFPNFETIAIEFQQNNQKWLLLGLYKPPNQKAVDSI